MKIITICGGGSLGHVVAGFLSSKGKAEVNILTNRPEQWTHKLRIDTPDGNILEGDIEKISRNPRDVIPESDIVLLCLPGFLIRENLMKIKPHLRKDTFVGCIFSSTGFFFEAMKILDEHQPLWGFQRVPFIARVADYGQTAHLLGYKSELKIAVEHSDRKEWFVKKIENWFDVPVRLLNNYYEASLTNSNPLLHTSRLYSMFGNGQNYDRMVMFYEEWTEDAANLLIKMDEEFFQLLDKLPVAKGFLPTILEYYESDDASSLAAKLSSIQGFKGIESPMMKIGCKWGADFSSRYFTEDFPYGLKYVCDLIHQQGIKAPHIDMVYEWGMKCISNERNHS